MEDLHHLDWQISFKNRVKKSNTKKSLLRKSFDKCQKEIVFKFCFNLSKVTDHMKRVPKASRLPLSVIDLCFFKPNRIRWSTARISYLGKEFIFWLWKKNMKTLFSLPEHSVIFTAQKTQFLFKKNFSKCKQIRK